jgi:hypothetical protein
MSSRNPDINRSTFATDIIDLLLPKLIHPLVLGVHNDLEACTVSVIRRELRKNVPVIVKDILDRLPNTPKGKVSSDSPEPHMLDDTERSISMRTHTDASYHMGMQNTDDNEEDEAK